MKMNETYKENGITIEEYVIRCSPQELEMIKTCLIAAVHSFQDLQYTKQELNELAFGMTLKKIDEMLNTLYNIPF